MLAPISSGVLHLVLRQRASGPQVGRGQRLDADERGQCNRSQRELQQIAVACRQMQRSLSDPDEISFLSSVKRARQYVSLEKILSSRKNREAPSQRLDLCDDVLHGTEAILASVNNVAEQKEQSYGQPRAA